MRRDRPGVRIAVQEKSGPDAFFTRTLKNADGRPGIDPHYARQFIEDAKSEGLIKVAIERAGLRGVAVAPLK
jgi:polar amino acid transport system substrate-binding protein